MLYNSRLELSAQINGEVFYTSIVIGASLLSLMRLKRVLTSLLSPSCRFLRMRGFNIPKAKEMFLSMLKWREDCSVDAIANVCGGYFV
jgi:hypothetical protein